MLIDNALINPYEVRIRALQSDYEDVDIPGDAIYKRISVQPVPELTSAVRNVRGNVVIVAEAFRLNFNQELPNNFCHADVGYGDIAAVLYLSLPKDCTGGTAFWTHKETGLDKLPEEGDKRRNEIVSDWVHEDKWKKNYMVPMVFNRLLIYPTQHFHSRYPQKSFGTGPSNGRLIAVGFYKTNQKEETNPWPLQL